MRTRFLLAALVAAVAAPAFADPPKPNLVVQLKPLDEWLADAKAIAKVAAPLLNEGPKAEPPKPAKATEDKSPAKPAAPPPGPPADPEKMIEDGFAQMLGPDWRKVIDTTAPLGGYAMFKPELKDAVLVGMFPVKDVPAFVKVLAKSGIMPEEKDGLYTVKNPYSPQPVYARAANGYVYVAREAAHVAPGDLLKPADVFSAKETASLTLRLRIDALPESLVKDTLAQMDQGLKAELDKQSSEGAKKVVQSMADSFKRLLTDGRELTIGIDFDRKAGDLAIILEAAARPGTPLAKAYREAKPTTSRFASLEKDAAMFFGLTFELPPLPDFDKELAQAAEELHKTIQKDGVKVEKGQVEQILKDMVAAADLERFDLAVAVYPGKSGQMSFVAGFGIKDGAKGDAVLAEVQKLMPKDGTEPVKFTTEKIGRTTFYRGEPAKIDPEIKAMFGSSQVTFAVAPDKLLLGMGADADSRIKAVAEAKPSASPLAVLEMSFGQLLPILEATTKDEKERDEMKKVRAELKDDAGRMRLFHLTRTTGESIKYRAGIDLLTPLKWAVAMQKAGIDLTPKIAPPAPAKP
jgi:hypothetical protein